MARSSRRRPLHASHGRLDRRLVRTHVVGGQLLEQQRQHADETGPAGLVARSEAGAIVPVEIFVEQQQVAPVWVLLQERLTPVDRAVTVQRTSEGADESVAQLLRDLVEV